MWKLEHLENICADLLGGGGSKMSKTLSGAKSFLMKIKCWSYLVHLKMIVLVLQYKKKNRFLFLLNTKERRLQGSLLGTAINQWMQKYQCGGCQIKGIWSAERKRSNIVFRAARDLFCASLSCEPETRCRPFTRQLGSRREELRRDKRLNFKFNKHRWDADGKKCVAPSQIVFKFAAKMPSSNDDAVMREKTNRKLCCCVIY